MSPKYVVVKNLQDYLGQTRKNFIIVDPGERKKSSWKKWKRPPNLFSGQVLYHEELLENGYLSDGISNGGLRKL